MNHYSFGKTLKTLRHEKGITQMRLAELLVISPQAISKWENDLGYPDLTLLIPLSDIFGVSIDYLLGRHAGAKDEALAAARARTTALWRDTLEHDRDNDNECIAIWRGLLAQYPADNECRNQLAFSSSPATACRLTKPWRECARPAPSIPQSSTKAGTATPVALP